jgi:hypothetical protein
VVALRPKARLVRVTILLLLAIVLLGGCSSSNGASGPASADKAGGSRPAALPVPAPLTDAALDMRAGPVPVPLELRMPSLDVLAPVLGVGMSPEDVMDAPVGPADDPVWNQAFWYRGSAVPGEPSTALIAGHAKDPLGRPGVFARIDDLRRGDPIVVRDTRDGLEVRFTVTETRSYPLAETTDPAVLTAIYGAGPVAGTWPQSSADGLSHLTLITCEGTFRDGTHDHRRVVYATRDAGA